MRKEDKKQEWITGIILGLIISLLLTVKALAAEPVVITEDVEFWSEEYGKKYDIQPEVLMAMCWVESRCDKTAQSNDKTCKGVMQINPKSHKDRMIRLNVRNIFDVQGNIKVGADYLAEILEDEEIEPALAIFNGQSSQKIEQARKGEYGHYIKEVMRVSEEIKKSRRGATRTAQKQ